MENFWDARYSGEEFAYGIKPNTYFKSQIDLLKPGKLLLPAEGEGRNAVYAAQKGWSVFAFDMSYEAKKKAEKLADRYGVSINYSHIGFGEMNYIENDFDMIALIFAHVPPDKREKYHNMLMHYLKPGGSLILEGFAKEQIGKDSGGPKKSEMLFSIDELKGDFSSTKNIKIQKEEVYLDEGIYHQGKAIVIRLKATK